MRALLLDLDGVVYQGDAPIRGAAEAVDWLSRQGVPHLFLTNTTSRPRAAIVERLARLGIRTAVDRILTPPVAASRWLQTHARGPAALFVPEATQAEFAGVPVLPDDAESGAAAVVLGDLGRAWDFDTLNRAFRLLMASPTPALVALGMTRYWRAPDGLRLDTAPFVAALQHASGVEPVVLGKPAGPFFETALSLLEAAPGETAMVGDDIRVDVAGAQQAGIRGVLVKTGKFKAEDLDGEVVPDAVLEDVTGLPQWWQNAAVP